MLIADKAAVIIGGAQGIGRACAEALLEKRGKVCIADVQEERGLETLKSLSTKYGSDRVIFSKCDICSEDDLRRTFTQTKDAFGNVDIFCPCAGIVNETRWELCVDINLSGVMRSTYVAMEIMSIENGGSGGVIVFVSSTAGLVGSLFQPVYCSTKHGVVAFTRAMGSAAVYQRHGIRYNALCPTMTDTPILNNFDSDEHVLHPEIARGLMDTSKLIKPSSVAHALVTCAEDDSLNGAILRVLKDGQPYIPDHAQNLPTL